MTSAAPLLARIQLLEQENAVLRAQIDWLKKKLFGGGQGERLDQAQMALELGELAKVTAHLDHGCTELDNNAMENAIRPTALGKKNWMFVGHPEAGERSAVIYSIIVSCRRFGKDPFLYLRDVLAKLPTMTNQDDLTPLLPSNWQPA